MSMADSAKKYHDGRATRLVPYLTQRHCLGLRLMHRTLIIAYWVLETVRRGAWAPLVVFLVNKVLLELFRLDESFPAIDVPMHLLGGAAIVYFFQVGLEVGSRRGLYGPLDRVVQVALVIGWTSLAALAWELYEWFSSVFLGQDILGDVHDTLGDLVLGILGGAALLLGSALWLNKTSRSRR